MPEKRKRFQSIESIPLSPSNVRIGISKMQSLIAYKFN